MPTVRSVEPATATSTPTHAECASGTASGHQCDTWFAAAEDFCAKISCNYERSTDRRVSSVKAIPGAQSVSHVHVTRKPFAGRGHEACTIICTTRLL